MTDSLERLRRANPVPGDLPAPPIEPVLRLVETEPANSQVDPRGPRHPAGRAALGLGVAMAVAVAALAVIFVGHSRVTSRPSAPASRQKAFASLKLLRSEFGILRRPQTAADRQFRVPAGTAIPALTRLAATLPAGERVYVTVDRVVVHPGGPADYALSTWVADGAMRRVWQYIAGTPLPVIPRRAQFASANITWVSLVPDPVKLVVWTFRRARTGRDVAVRVPVVGNVAVLRAKASVAPSAPSVRWYGAHAQRLAAAEEPVLADLARWPASGELTGNSVLGVRLGTPYRTAVDQLDHELHTAPSRPYTKVRGACDADHSAAWGVLTAYFWHGSFIGYQYGRFGSAPQTPVLRGPRGLAVGETIAAAEEQFGHAFASGTEQGGSWSVHTASAGLLMGLASQPHGGTIATIAAGSVGCPALTP